jgi:hypothetical protein
MNDLRCKHTGVVDGDHFGYQASVHTPGVTDKNPAAAGGITYDQRCTRCGAVRAVNYNGGHFEYSVWRQARRGL